jgi:diaminopimelate epimerase
MKFYKYHGTGNDFICIDNKHKNINLSSSEIKFLCDINFGIGADGWKTL